VWLKDKSSPEQKSCPQWQGMCFESVRSLVPGVVLLEGSMEPLRGGTSWEINRSLPSEGIAVVLVRPWQVIRGWLL
jgi:hypothetical protein